MMSSNTDRIAVLEAEIAALKTENRDLRQQVTNLTQSQMLLHSIIDNSPSIICALDRDERYILANQRFADTLNRDVTDLLNCTADELFPLEVAQQLRTYTRNVIEMGEPIEHEMEISHEDGLHTYIESKFPIVDQQGEIQAVGCISTDITERKRVEQALRSSEKRFRTLIEAIPIAVCLTSEERTFDYINPAYERLYGYTHAELIGQPFTKIIPPENYQVANSLHDSFIAGETEIPTEWTVRTSDGLLLTILANAVLLTDIQGRRQKATFVINITGRKQQEEELRMFETIVTNAPDPIGFATLDGTLTYANPAYHTFTGYDDLIGMHITDLVPPEIREFVMSVIIEGTKNDVLRGVAPFQRADGTVVNTNSTHALVCDANGQPQGIVGLFRDLTEQQRAEAEREQLQQQVIDAQQAAIRELSTPLIPIADEVVIMPLIGTIDSRRAQQVLEALLEGVAHHQADLAILDITGVHMVDTQVAQSLMQAARAVRLLGAQVMLTGIQPQIAQTLVHLGVDLREIITRGSLQAGIQYALYEDRRYQSDL